MLGRFKLPGYMRFPRGGVLSLGRRCWLMWDRRFDEDGFYWSEAVIVALVLWRLRLSWEWETGSGSYADDDPEVAA